MNRATKAFSRMTIRSRINQFVGLIYALRSDHLSGMNDVERTSNIRTLQWGIGLLGLSIAERSLGAGMAAIGTLAGPLNRLSKAGARTAEENGVDWGMRATRGMAVAAIAALLVAPTGTITKAQAMDIEPKHKIEHLTPKIN